MAKLYLVWNAGRNECVGFLDKRDADYTATGHRRHLDTPWRPSIGEAFRENYGDEAKRLPQTVVDIPDATP